MHQYPTFRYPYLRDFLGKSTRSIKENVRVPSKGSSSSSVSTFFNDEFSGSEHSFITLEDLELQKTIYNTFTDRNHSDCDSSTTITTESIQQEIKEEALGDKFKSLLNNPYITHKDILLLMNNESNQSPFVRILKSDVHVYLAKSSFDDKDKISHFLKSIELTPETGGKLCLSKAMRNAALVSLVNENQIEIHLNELDRLLSEAKEKEPFLRPKVREIDIYIRLLHGRRSLDILKSRANQARAQLLQVHSSLQTNKFLHLNSFAEFIQFEDTIHSILKGDHRKNGENISYHILAVIFDEMKTKFKNNPGIYSELILVSSSLWYSELMGHIKTIDNLPQQALDLIKSAYSESDIHLISLGILYWKVGSSLKNKDFLENSDICFRLLSQKERSDPDVAFYLPSSQAFMALIEFENATSQRLMDSRRLEGISTRILQGTDWSQFNKPRFCLGVGVSLLRDWWFRKAIIPVISYINSCQSPNLPESFRVFISDKPHLRASTEKKIDRNPIYATESELRAYDSIPEFSDEEK